jgi:hypothetical protein
MSEWQSIDTAPMNMKNILVAGNFGDSIKYAHAFYVPRFTEHAYNENIEYCEEKDDYFTLPGWYEVCISCDYFPSWKLFWQPTHWMPIPKLPEDLS